MNGQYQLPTLTGALSGYGCMALFILNLDTQKAWILPYVNSKLFSQVLADFAQHFGVGQDKHIVLVVDQAGWHTSEQVKIPPGIHLSFLPAYSPELQPAERLWSLTNEPIANRTFESLDELEEVLVECCRQLLSRPDFIRGLTNFYWWSELVV